MSIRHLVFALFLLMACSRASGEISKEASGAAVSADPSSRALAEPPPKPEPRRPYHVLFIMVDAWRADMPWAGYPRDVAPRLAEFAARSTLYPRGYALSSYTAKSVAPMLAGRYPSEMPRDGYFFTRCGWAI